MKQIFFVPCIIFVLLSAANAERIYKCVDSNGDTVITSTPQDGMKCFNGESNAEIKSQKISTKTNRSSKTNLVDICSDLYLELDETSTEITALEKRRSELQREQLDIRQSELEKEQSDARQYERRLVFIRGNRATYAVQSSIPATPVNPLTAEINKLYKESIILQQRRTLIYQDIGLYKCNELYNDLSKLHKDGRRSGTGRYRSYR